jgi:hypothetical protein
MVAWRFVGSQGLGVASIWDWALGFWLKISARPDTPWTMPPVPQHTSVAAKTSVVVVIIWRW